MKKLYWYFLIILLVGIFIIIVSVFSENNEKNITLLKVKVMYDESKFIICNNDSFDYLNIKITINERFNYVWKGF